MLSRPARIQVLMALAASLMTLSGAALARADTGPTISATVGSTPTGQRLPTGYVGVSVEYRAIHQYTGRDPDHLDPVLLGLLRGLAPGQSPVLRIGGDSTDATWWPVRGVIPRGGVNYSLSKGWLRTTHALAADLGARLILGINLAANRAALAAAEARALLSGIGRRYLGALEIGNEPDLYGTFAWYRDRRGRVVHARGGRYDLSEFIKEFTRWSRVLPKLPLVGPSFSALTWMSGLGRFLSAEKAVRTVTVHRYPLHNSTTDPTNPTYPSIPNLLADAASSGMAQQLAPYVATAHAHKLAFRVDEMNSVSGRGRAGVSDTFASALWILDALFDLASAGADGVNVHTLPGSAYELFTFSHPQSGWEAAVHPEYYGMLMFARAFPAGARLLQVSVPSGPVKVWATTGADGRTRVTLINKDPVTPVSVRLRLPGAASTASLQRLTAPSIDATGGVTLGGQTFGPETTSGTLGPAQAESVAPVLGSYTVSLPAGSAALLIK